MSSKESTYPKEKGLKPPVPPSPPMSRIIKGGEKMPNKEALKELQNLNKAVNAMVTTIISQLENNQSYEWDTKYTHFKVVNIVTVMLSNLNFRFSWSSEDKLIISIR